jgi:26S proteasome regulatory subunit T4
MLPPSLARLRAKCPCVACCRYVQSLHFRLDRKIEIPLANEGGRLEILKIHAAPIAKHGDIDYESVIKLADGFNGADLRNVCTEAGSSSGYSGYSWAPLERRVQHRLASCVADDGSLALAGMFAIRAERDYVMEEDFMKAVRKLADNKKLESSSDYQKV